MYVFRAKSLTNQRFGGKPMTKEYEAYLAYREAREPKKKECDPVYEDFLAHYGVKGQKWGTRQWQNVDGTYTEAGKHHYGWGYGRLNQHRESIAPAPSKPPKYAKSGPTPYRQSPYARSARSSQQARQGQLTQREIEERKARTRRIIGIAAGVAVAAALGYAAYRGSTKLRDNMRAEVFKRFDTDPRNLHTLHSKYWDAADRARYTEMTAERAKTVSQNLTRRDAVAAKVYDKTGVRVNVPQSRARVLEQRQSEMNYSNFIRDAEKRGHMNKTIHDARQELKAAQKKLSNYQNTPHIGTSKQYESLWNQRHLQNVEAARERLNNLLSLRRAG